MCNLYSITTNQAAIIALFRVINRYVGNLPPMPGVFPDPNLVTVRVPHAPQRRRDAEYERVMKDDPDADFLVCGDFNTPPDSEPVVNQLHMMASRDDVAPTRTEPRLFGLLSGK